MILRHDRQHAAAEIPKVLFRFAFLHEGEVVPRAVPRPRTGIVIVLIGPVVLDPVENRPLPVDAVPAGGVGPPAAVGRPLVELAARRYHT